MNQDQYIQTVLRAYLQSPETALRPRPADRNLAARLYHRRVPLQDVLGAILLATARRIFRPPPPLPPIRSLHYFLPVIDEIQNHDVDPGYLEYLEYKLRHRYPARLTAPPQRISSRAEPHAVAAKKRALLAANKRAR